MIPKLLYLGSTPELVTAYETLREAVLSSGEGATTAFHEQHLRREGLLSWGVSDASTRSGPSALDVTLGDTPESHGMPSGQAAAAVVSLMATMTLQSISPVEGAS